MVEELWDDFYFTFASTELAAEFFLTCFSVEYIFCNRFWAIPLLVVCVFLYAKKLSRNYGIAGVGVIAACVLKLAWSHSIVVIVLFRACKLGLELSQTQSVLPLHIPDNKEPLAGEDSSSDATCEKTCLYLF